MKIEEINQNIVKRIILPKKNSAKGDNGVLLIIAGGEKFYAPVGLTTLVASKIIDGILVSSTENNLALLEKLKTKLFDFVPTKKREIKGYEKIIDTILLGPGMGKNLKIKKYVNNIIKRNMDKKILVDADALKVLDKKMLNEKMVITPSHSEFKLIFKKEPTVENAAAMAKKYNCTILLKGEIDYICTPKECYQNKNGNAGLTKAFTGDVLAGVIAALMTKNDLVTATCAGAFLQGAAADELFKAQSYFYSPTDLANQIPKTLGSIINHGKEEK